VKVLKILGYLLGLVWSLPMLPVALLLMIYYKPRKIRWHKGCVEFLAGWKRDKNGDVQVDEEGHKITRMFGNPGGQCLGVPIIGFADERCWENPGLKIHERRHCEQGFVLGILFGPLYGGHWLLIRCFDTPDEPKDAPAWKRAYWAIWFEEDARQHAREHVLDGWGA
jgi:hypothetical protein